VLGKPTQAWSEGEVLNCASFGLQPSVEVGPTYDTAFPCLLGTSCCCIGTAVEKDALLGVVEHAVGSSSKPFLPITAEAQILVGPSSCGTRGK